MAKDVKFFTMIGKDGKDTYYDLYVCDINTPIPTAEEIVERKRLNPCCAHDEVKQISALRWYWILMKMYAYYIFGKWSNELEQYCPRNGCMTFWEWWSNEVDE